MKLNRIKEILREAEKIDEVIVSNMRTYSQEVFWRHNIWGLKIALCAFQKILQKYHLAPVVSIEDTDDDFWNSYSEENAYDLSRAFGEQVWACMSGSWEMELEYVYERMQDLNAIDGENGSAYGDYKKYMVAKYGEEFFPYFDQMYKYITDDLISFEDTIILSNKRLYEFEKKRAGKLSQAERRLYDKLKDSLSGLFTFSFDYSVTGSERCQSYFWIWSTGYANDIDDSIAYLHISFASLVSHILIDRFMDEVERN